MGSQRQTPPCARLPHLRACRHSDACPLVTRSPGSLMTLPQASSPSRLNPAAAAPSLHVGRGGLDRAPSACGVTGREPGGTRPRLPGGLHCRTAHARPVSRELRRNQRINTDARTTRGALCFCGRSVPPTRLIAHHVSRSLQLTRCAPGQAARRSSVSPSAAPCAPPSTSLAQKQLSVTPQRQRVGAIDRYLLARYIPVHLTVEHARKQ